MDFLPGVASDSEFLLVRDLAHYMGLSRWAMHRRFRALGVQLWRKPGDRRTWVLVADAVAIASPQAVSRAD